VRSRIRKHKEAVMRDVAQGMAQIGLQIATYDDILVHSTFLLHYSTAQNYDDYSKKHSQYLKKSKKCRIFARQIKPFG
jgi:hypothetical protein